MLPVFIVEDDGIQREEIEKVVQNFILVEEVDMEIFLSTANPYECLRVVEEYSDLRGLYFLDVDLGVDLDGIKLGRMIREYDSNGRIVFVTTKSEMAYFTFLYRVEALDYIIKDSADDINSRIRGCLEVAYRRYLKINSQRKAQLEINVGKSARFYPMDEVLFIETCKKEDRLVLHTSKGIEEFSGTMREMERNYPELMRCHRSFLVNLNRVKSFDEQKMQLDMDNNKRVYVSARKKSIIRKLLKDKHSKK